MPAHGLAPQNLSSDKHVDVCADGDEDRGSTPLASRLLIISSLDQIPIVCRNFSRNTSAIIHRRLAHRFPIDGPVCLLPGPRLFSLHFVRKHRFDSQRPFCLLNALGETDEFDEISELLVV